MNIVRRKSVLVTHGKGLKGEPFFVSSLEQ